MGLRRKTFSAVRWTTLLMLGKASLHILQLIIMARLLVPEDFGLMAIVMAIIAIALIFSDLGISNAIIHFQNINNDVLSGLYWLNVLAGASLTVLLLTLSPVISYLYGIAELQNIIMVISPYFLIASLGQQLKVLAEKNLQFLELTYIELSGALIGLIVAIYIALNDGGVYALVIGFLVNAVVVSVLLWFVLSDGWRPLIRLNIKETKPFLSFGIYMIGNNLVSTINQNSDIFIGGRLLGSSVLGVYSLPRELALRISGVINQIVTRVGLPVMAKLQNDKDKLKEIYLKTIRMTASINFPIYFLLAIFAEEIILIVFGEQWYQAIPVLRILAIWGMIRAIGNPVGSLIFSLGKSKLAFYWNLSLVVVTLPVIWGGAHYGNTGLAWAVLFLAICVFIPAWYFLIRPLCGAGLVEYSKQIAIPLTVSLISLLPLFFVMGEVEGHFLKLVTGSILFFLVYIILSYFFNKDWYMAMYELLFSWNSRKNSGN